VLGGMGSLAGVVIGALIMITVPEILRTPALAGLVFYLSVVIILFSVLRPRLQTPILVVAVATFGTLLRALAGNPPGALPASGSALVDTIRSWLVIPANYTVVGNYAFGGLVLMILLVSRIKAVRLRFVALIPTLYLLVFVWETRLSQEPSVTRLLFVGVLLVVLMIYRPNGLLGQKRVEIV
jgi:hypothetical protein